MSYHNSLKYIVILCFLVLIFIATPKAAVWADNELHPLGEEANSSLDARQKANEYSHSTGGVGMVMSYGTKNTVSAEQIGDAFVTEINSRGVNARYFYYRTDRDGVAVSFRIQWSSMGPWNTQHAAAQISKVVKRAKAAKKIHGN